LSRDLCLCCRPRGGTEKILVTLMSRERAPLLATRDMFVNNSDASSIGNPFGRITLYRLCEHTI